MKFIASLIVMLFATGAMAHDSGWGAEPGWDELQMDQDITINWPAHQGVPINNLCVDGASFRTLKPVSYCTRTIVKERRACTDGEATHCRVLGKNDEPSRWERLEEDYVCSEYTTRQNYILSREYRASECVKWHEPISWETDHAYCERFRDVTKVAPLTWEVEYHNAREFIGEAGMMPKYKMYTIPRCQ